MRCLSYVSPRPHALAKREGRLPPAFVQRRLQEHEDLGGSVEREPLEPRGKLAQLDAAAVRPAATASERVGRRARPWGSLYRHSSRPLRAGAYDADCR